MIVVITMRMPTILISMKEDTTMATSNKGIRTNTTMTNTMIKVLQLLVSNLSTDKPAMRESL